jgi:hypothetical protein
MNCKKNEDVVVDTSSDVFSLQFWRDKFQVLFEAAPDFERKNLVIYDSYFMLAVAKDAVTRVKSGKAGFEVTRRVVMALEQYVDAKMASEKNMERTKVRQKLVIPEY